MMQGNKMAHTEGGEVVKQNDCDIKQPDLELMIDLEYCRTLPTMSDRQNCILDAKATYENSLDAQSIFIGGIVIAGVIVFLATIYIITKNMSK